jgi:hypothetical protein
MCRRALRSFRPADRYFFFARTLAPRPCAWRYRDFALRYAFAADLTFDRARLQADEVWCVGVDGT